jgi:hypothetical protein
MFNGAMLLQVWREAPRWVRVLAAVLLAAQALLTGAYAAMRLAHHQADRVDLDLEANLPAWWSSLVLVAVAGACLAMSLLARAGGRRDRRWLLAAAGFLGLSLEEVAQVHEEVGLLVGGSEERVSVWPLVYLPVLALGAVVLVRCMRDLSRPQRLMVGIGLALYAVAIAAETAAISVETRGSEEVLVEENAEMLGTSLVLLALALACDLRARAALGALVRDAGGAGPEGPADAEAVVVDHARR